MFNSEKYFQSLHTQWLGHDLRYFEALPSTNTYCKSLAADDLSHGFICLADDQTEGRGQYNRPWASAAGCNLTYTLGLKPTYDGSFHVLTLALACAAVDEIQSLVGGDVRIKWPNDIMINDKKVAGLLTETVFSGNTLERLLIGMGLNVNQQSFGNELEAKAISLCQVTGEKLSREEILCSILSRFEHLYTQWQKQQDDLLKHINQKIIGYGEWVHFSLNGTPMDAKYKLLGINAAGMLTAIDKDGGIKTFTHEQIRLITD